MKKILLILSTLLTVFSSNAENQNRVDIVDLKSNELIIILNRTDDDNFNEYYVYQYQNYNYSFFADKQSMQFISSNEESITLNCDGETIVLAVGTNGGYGLSHLNGSFKLNRNLENYDKVYQLDIVLAVGPGGSGVGSGGSGGGDGKITCDHGGKGATSCSASQSVASVSSSCSVTCGSGYYACCDDGRMLCKCIKNSASGTSNGGNQITTNLIGVAASNVKFYFSTL